MSLPVNQIIVGDCLEKMKTFPPESVDLIVTDPPYQLSSICRSRPDQSDEGSYGREVPFSRVQSRIKGFMGKDWDVLPKVEVWKECLRVLKSGAFAFVMCTPRLDSLSQMAVNLKTAGFDIGFTPIYWTYASGFPKAMNIGKAADKRLGVKSEIVGKYIRKGSAYQKESPHNQMQNGKAIDGRTTELIERRLEKARTEGIEVTTPTSQEAKVLDGSYGGFQPKPAVEIIIVCMKPLRAKTFVDQALANGKGVTWLDNCRIPHGEPMKLTNRTPRVDENVFSDKSCGFKKEVNYIASAASEGRFPANLLVSDDVLNDGMERKSQHIEKPCNTPNLKTEWGGTIQTNRGERGYDDSGSFSRYFDLDKWFEKTIENLPESVRKTFPFLICPKASKSERNQGCGKIDPQFITEQNKWSENDYRKGTGEKTTEPKGNFHPTVKPLKLMSYLVILGSREGDVVLDPFVGSGTTCMAAEILSRKWIGIDVSGEYVEIANPRIQSVKRKDGSLEEWTK